MTDFKIGDAVTHTSRGDDAVVIKTHVEAVGIRTRQGEERWVNSSSLQWIIGDFIPGWIVAWCKENLPQEEVIEPVKFAVGDAVKGKVTGTLYVVSAILTNSPDSIECRKHDGHTISNKPNLLSIVISSPDWVIKWRKENMPQEDFEPLDLIEPIDARKPIADAPRKEAQKNIELAAMVEDSPQFCTIDFWRAANQRLVDRNETLTKKLAKRDKTVTALEREAGNLQRKLANMHKVARNDCDRHEMQVEVISELRAEIENNCKAHELLKDVNSAWQQRAVEAEKDLKSATTIRDASIQTADAQLEAPSSARKELRIMTGWRDGALESSNSWCAEYQLACRELQELKKELAAEKLHNEDHAEHISKLCEELSEIKRYRDRAVNSREWWEKHSENQKATLRNLREELKAEKAFNAEDSFTTPMGEIALAAAIADRDHLKHDLRDRVNERDDLLVKRDNLKRDIDSQKQALVRLRSVHANVSDKLSETRQILKGAQVSRDSWRGRAERAELSIINARIEEIGYEENQHDFEVLNNECTRWAQKYNEAEGEIETLNEMLKNSTDTRVLLENALEIEKRRLPGPPICPACTEEMASISKLAVQITELESALANRTAESDSYKAQSEEWHQAHCISFDAHVLATKLIESLKKEIDEQVEISHQFESHLLARTAERDSLKLEASSWRTSCENSRAQVSIWQQNCADSNSTKSDLQQKLDAIIKVAAHTEGE